MIENRIHDLAQIDRSRLIVDLKHGAYNAYTAYGVTKGKIADPDCIVFQCDCGRLGVLPTQALNAETFKQKIKDSRLLCSECGTYEVDFEAPIELTGAVAAGLHELQQLFGRAVADNYMTLCWYFYSSLRSFQPRFMEAHSLCESIFDLHHRSLLQAQLHTDKLSPLRLDIEEAHRQEMMVMLLLINHVTEIAELYDILYTIAMIAKSEHFLVRDDGVSFQDVGLQLHDNENDQDRLKRRIVNLRRAIHQLTLLRLSNLIRIAFNHELRNAFSHSEYKLSNDGVYLTRYHRTVSSSSLVETFLGAYLVQKSIFDFMAVERQRFIRSGGYEEQGWRIAPIVEGNNFAINLTFSAPGPGVTGRVRRRRLGLDASEV